MPEDLEALRKRIEEGVEAAEQMRRILKQQELGARGERKKRFRIIKGGLIGAGIWAGVEWFRNYRRTAAALALSGLTVTGAVIAEQPHSPGSDPPQTVKPPSVTRPSATPSERPKPTTALTPRRTSPPRTQVPARITPPPVAPTVQPTQVPTKTPTSTPTKPKPSVTNTVTDVTTAVPSLLPTPTITSIITTPDACTINLLGVRVCLPLG